METDTQQPEQKSPIASLQEKIMQAARTDKEIIYARKVIATIKDNQSSLDNQQGEVVLADVQHFKNAESIPMSETELETFQEQLLTNLGVTEGLQDEKRTSFGGALRGIYENIDKYPQYRLGEYENTVVMPTGIKGINVHVQVGEPGDSPYLTLAMDKTPMPQEAKAA